MGIYLYGLKKLSKPQRITREDGAVVTATHTLNYRHKLSFGWDGDGRMAFICGQLDSMHPAGFKGVVLYGEQVIEWNGRPHWVDSDKWPGTVWGVATDVTGDDDSRHPEKAKASKARLDSHVLQAVSRVGVDGKTYTMRVTLQRSLMVLTAEKRVVASQDVYAVRLADGTIEFRGAGFATALPLRGVTDDEVFHEFDTVCKVASDWLHENSPTTIEQVAS